jgi:hypothetical protein
MWPVPSQPDSHDVKFVVATMCLKTCFEFLSFLKKNLVETDSKIQIGCNTPLVTHNGYYQNSSHQTYSTQEM